MLLQNRYRVIKWIGGGGFGQVFEVEDGETRKVLKVLDPSGFSHAEMSQKVIALFQREAAFLSQFRHPGVPKVEPDGYFTWARRNQAPLHCLVMEKIEGQTLQQWVSQVGPSGLSQEQAIAWLGQLAHILHLLHQQRFFHRDIKPSNIMLRPDGQLVLIDFGAVREMSATYWSKQRKQETGTAIVSAGYTPPEQIEGRAVSQSDFFALGRTFVCLLTQRNPIDLPKDAQTGQLIWRDRAPQVAPQLANLIDQLMAPLPSQRPETGADIFNALTRIQTSLRYQRWLSWLRRLYPNRSPRFLVDRRQVRRTLIKLALLSTLLVGGASLWGFRFALSARFNDWGLDAYESGDFNTAWQDYQIALLFNHKNRQAYHNLGVLYEDQQRLDQARAAYQIALEGKLAESFNNLARLNILDQHYDQALPLLKQGLPLAKTSIDRYNLLKNLGWAELGLQHYDQAQQFLETAQALHPERAAAHCLMGQLMQVKRKPAAQTEWSLCRRYANPSNPDEQNWVKQAPTHPTPVGGQP